ncbi:MAG TPA: site-specific integrase [Pedobacter sp.]|jgi:integrase
MVSYKVLLDQRRMKQDGTYPLVLRVYHNRKSVALPLEVSLKPQGWNSKSNLIKSTYPNSDLLNRKVTEYFLKIQEVCLELNRTNQFSFYNLKNRLITPEPQLLKKINFKEFSHMLIKDLMVIKKTGNAIVYQTATNRFMNFCPSKNIEFEKIDYKVLQSFNHYLVESGVKPNSISNYFRTIRAIYNKAIKSKLVDSSYYPFNDFTVKTEKTSKRSIGKEELQKLYTLRFESTCAQYHSINFFFLSFSLIGMSFTDLAYLKPCNIKKNRIVFRRRKTGKVYDIALNQLSRAILDNYKNFNGEYLLPILPNKVDEDSLVCKRLIQQWIKTTNKYLKRLSSAIGSEIPITTYVARHSWATIAKKQGYSIELIAEALGHEFGNRTTAIYLDSFDKELIDQANRTIVEVVLKKPTFTSEHYQI